MVDTFTKDSLTAALAEISERGYIQSHRDTSKRRNDGAAGNLLEQLLGIEENNLPLPNANEWELKVQRSTSNSLVTLFHKEPSPRAIKFVHRVLLPLYGWPHQQAGSKHPSDEMSFRQTIPGPRVTDRGFYVNCDNNRVEVHFDSSEVSPRHAEWLATVAARVGLGDLDPVPYWGFQDLEALIASKLTNVVYVTADVKRKDKQEYFHYKKAEMLSGFSMDNFLEKLALGEVLVEFDARTRHNHGTKFRTRQQTIHDLYAHDVVLFDHPPAQNIP